MRKKIEKNFWDMEIIGNRRKNKLFTAQDRDLEYLFWQRKNSSVSSDLKQPLAGKS